MPRCISKKPSTVSWGDYSGQFSFPNWNTPRGSNAETTFLKPPDFLSEMRQDSFGSSGSGSGSGSVRFALNQIPMVEVVDPVDSGMEEIAFISNHFKKKTLNDDACEDWRFMAQVFDRIFLYIFCCICIGGTFAIVLRAPVIYDTRKPLTDHYWFE